MALHANTARCVPALPSGRALRPGHALDDARRASVVEVTPRRITKGYVPVADQPGVEHDGTIEWTR